MYKCVNLARFTLALLRHGFRGSDVAELLGKHGNSVTSWLSKGLSLERSDPDFERRLDLFDARISSCDSQFNRCERGTSVVTAGSRHQPLH